MIPEYFNHCMTEDELRKEHRRLVVKMHPDRNLDDPDATAKFQEMQAQYEERLAELHGDYRASAKGRERRERAEREQREANRVNDVINEARRNKSVRFDTLKAGAYIYARKVEQECGGAYEWDYLRGRDIVSMFFDHAAEPETVVKIEAVVELGDKEIMERSLSCAIDGIYGGWETLQNPTNTAKGKRVPKVVMFRSQRFCFFGNPKGDHVVSDYYVHVSAAVMFGALFIQMAAEKQRKEEERQRKMAELKAKIVAEQQPLIAAWEGKLIAISAALTTEEKETVAVSNLRKMLKARFPGAAIRVTKSKVICRAYQLIWQDGPTVYEANETARLFESYGDIVTPWNERFGRISLFNAVRRMSTLAKASILEHLGEVSDVFTTAGYDDYVEVSDTDWMMINLMVGKTVEEGKDDWFCHTQNGKREVQVGNVVEYIFDNTSYAKKPKAKKKAVKTA
nr:MAG TPA: DnaJ domain protein [Caudoviricetes sp.]